MATTGQPRSGLSPQALLSGAQTAAALAAEHAAWAEQHGRLHSDVIAALVQAGIGRLFLPSGLGGYETDPVTCARFCETLADGDSSAAWFVMVYNSARLMAANWPQTMVEALWGDNPDAMVAASGHTPFIGIRDGDDFIVSGRNSFVSGCHHADYVMSPMLVDGQAHVVVVPASECRIVDNWDTLGMRGTGSNDVVLDQVRVPGHLVAAQADLKPNALYSGTLYRCPSRVVFATYIPTALSLARRALAELDNLAGNKVPYATDMKLAKRSIAQIHYGKGLAQYRSVRGYFLHALAHVWQRAAAGDEFSAIDRADLYLAGTHTMQTCAAVVRHVADAAGSSVFDKSQPLERIVRDMETLRHHGFANESRYGSVAQVHWDVTLDYPLLLR